MTELYRVAIIALGGREKNHDAKSQMVNLISRIYEYSRVREWKPVVQFLISLDDEVTWKWDRRIYMPTSQISFTATRICPALAPLSLCL